MTVAFGFNIMWKNGIKIALAILVIIILAATGYFMLHGMTVLLNDSKNDFAERDPMFAEPTETVTRPPQLDAEETQPDHPTLDDYKDDVSSPVDRTAEDLIKIEQSKT